MEERYICMAPKNDEFIVDIIMMAYNHEDYIRQALESIFCQQTRFSYKIIVGEDGSTDRTRDILLEYYNKYPEKMELILWKKNAGMLENELEVLRRCRSKYVATLEGDDYWTSPFKLEKQIRFLEEHPEYIGTCHNIRCVNEEGALLHRDFQFFPVTEEHIYGKRQALKGQLAGQSASLVHRNMFRQWSEKEWDYYKEAKVNGDVKIHSVLGILGNIYCFRDVMSDYRRTFTGDSWTASVDWSNRLWAAYQTTYELRKYLSFMGLIETDMDDYADFVLKDALKSSVRKLLCEWNVRNLQIWWKLFWEWVKENERKGRRRLSILLCGRDRK